MCDVGVVCSDVGCVYWEITCHQMRFFFFLLTSSIFLITGIPKDGHKEERGTA